MESALTDGILVEVKSIYLHSHSRPEDYHFVFAYTVHISNQGESAATLKTRHWVIANAKGTYDEVRGPGVIGETPRIKPGQTHTYQSFSVLNTPLGTMHGSFQMVRDDGNPFDAEIPTFLLSTQSDDSKLVLN